MSDVLKEAGFTLSPRKCIFAAPTKEFLGYELSGDGLEPVASKLAAAKNHPVPTTAQECRRFIYWLSNFFRRFVPKFAAIARSITELTKKKKILCFAGKMNYKLRLIH